MKKIFDKTEIIRLNHSMKFGYLCKNRKCCMKYDGKASVLIDQEVLGKNGYEKIVYCRKSFSKTQLLSSWLMSLIFFQLQHLRQSKASLTSQSSAKVPSKKQEFR